jgi:signal transduction histidine kinase
MNDSASLEEDRMVRSVKLFINQTDEAFRSDAQAHAFTMNIDSAAFMQILYNRFNEEDWDFTADWYQGTAPDGEAKSSRGLVIAIHTLNEIPALHIQHISPYLLGLMWPEFIFALVLLSLSVSALIILYRSLKTQLVLNELRNDFIANISHELKTPVSTVKVALEALQKFNMQKDPRVSADYLEMASRETVRLEGLVGKVLQHQLLENPGSMIHKETCDLGKILQSALKSMEIPIREYGASATLIETDLPCQVMADPVYLEGVIINLIDNSLKYAGPHPEIEAGLECTEKGKKLMIRDKGPGIPDQYRDQVFDKFFRIPAGDHHNVKGYGLGLNFAAQVMHQLGGSISFRNLAGGGCEFILEFPMR